MITYQTAHNRVRAARGLPSEHICKCGNQASEWAYDHKDPEELYELVTFPSGQYAAPYSQDIGHYQPLCVWCHRDLDLHRKQRDSEARLDDPFGYSLKDGIEFGCE